MEPTYLPSLILFLNSMLNYRGRFYLSAIVFDLWRFTLPEFRIAGFRSKIHTIAIIKFCHKKKYCKSCFIEIVTHE
jgi:hypothetical protein